MISAAELRERADDFDLISVEENSARLAKAADLLREAADTIEELER